MDHWLESGPAPRAPEGTARNRAQDPEGHQNKLFALRSLLRLEAMRLHEKADRLRLQSCFLARQALLLQQKELAIKQLITCEISCRLLTAELFKPLKLSSITLLLQPDVTKMNLVALS